jgi:hypothetical protein
MTDDELIKHVLCDYPIYYLMYQGGAGGEFLTNLISQHSMLFKKYTKDDMRIDENNRSFVKIPNLFQLVGANKSKKRIGDPIDTLIATIKKTAGDELQYNIRDSIKYLNSDSKPPLFRCHLSTNEYFGKNTYLMLIDTSDWYDYTQSLLFLKVSNKMHSCPTDEERIKLFEYEFQVHINNIKIHQCLTDGLEYVIKNKIDMVYEQHIITLELMPFIPELTIDYIFSTDPIELHKKYYKFQNSHDEIYQRFEEIYEKRNATFIKYSRLFQKGYLENLFEIDSTSFHYELLEWHERNLELMSKNNFDYTKYKL